MLSLDDPKWNELEGGYKVPYNPTVAIRNLEAGEQIDDAWKELWNELHHQGNIGEASYAAVPHLVRIHKQTKKLDWNLYAIVSTIEVERHRTTNPTLPKWLESSYVEAWKNILELGLNDLRNQDDELSVRAILGALALAKGLLSLGALVSYSEESEISEYLEETMAWSELYR